MHYTLVKNVVKEGMAEEYAEVSKRFGKAMEQVPGCLAFEVIRSCEDPQVVANLIRWESREAALADDGSTFLAFKAELRQFFVTNTTESFEVL